MSGLSWRVWVASGLVTAGIGLAAPPATPATTRVEAGRTRFNPARIEIVLGDSVVWDAADEGHTVTARDGSFDSSSRGLMAEGDQYRYRFRVPGTYGYFCRVHQNQGMVGEVIVIDPSAPPTTSSTRLTPVTAPATTSTIATTTTTASTTTTSRVLATSSSTSPAVAASTAPRGAPALPNEAPPINPATPVIGSSNPAEDGDEFSQAPAAARTSDGTDGVPGAAVGIGVLAALGLAAGAAAFRTRRH